MLKEGMLDLIEFAHKRGFTTVLVTNGFLIDETMAEKIAHSGLDVASISLDSLDANIHDFLRGQRGAHQWVMQAIGYLDKFGAKSVSILTVIMGPNIDSLIGLAEWINGNYRLTSIYFQAISQPISTPKDSRWYKKEEFRYLWPQDETHLSYIIDRLVEYKKEGYKISNSVRQLEMFKAYFSQLDRFGEGIRCNQSDYIVYIRPTGEVLLCGSMAPVGNVRRDSIKDLWYSEEARGGCLKKATDLWL